MANHPNRTKSLDQIAYERAAKAVLKAKKKNQFGDLADHEIMMAIVDELVTEFRITAPVHRYTGEIKN